MNKTTHVLERGFTVIELVVTAVFISIFAGCALFFVHQNPRTPEMHDAQRLLDVAHLTQALEAYVADNGALPKGLTNAPQVIGSQAGELNWCAYLVPTYLKDILLDPATGAQLSNGTCAAAESFYTTGYTIEQSKDGTVTVAAPMVESDVEDISVSHKF